jgi:peroxiredoxin
LPARRLVALLIGALAVGALGLYAGKAARRHFGAPPTPAAGASSLVAGVAFPDVPLLDRDGSAIGSSELLAGEGAVVLFLDPDCGACGETAARWQARGVRLLGITDAPFEQIDAFAARHALTFPIYRDDASSFTTTYGVTSFPFHVVVGRSGRIEESPPDP